MKENLGFKNNNNLPLNEEISRKDLPLDDQDYLVIEYADHLDVEGKKVKVKNLGEKFASINSFFFDYLKEYHIPAAYVKPQNSNALKFIKHQRFPFDIKILNLADKRTAKLFSMKEGDPLTLPIFEVHMGDGKDSLISESHLIAFDLCANDELKIINRICSKVNAVLKSFFERRGFLLAQTSCSFGKLEDKIYLVDDFTPRSMKILPAGKNGKDIDPFKFHTSVEIRHYTDQLYNMMSA